MKKIRKRKPREQRKPVVKPKRIKPRRRRTLKLVVKLKLSLVKKIKVRLVKKIK